MYKIRISHEEMRANIKTDRKAKLDASLEKRDASLRKIKPRFWRRIRKKWRLWWSFRKSVMNGRSGSYWSA
jgi:hypothetical protein